MSKGWDTDAWHRQHPICGTDMSKHPAVLVKEIRLKLGELRGQLSDIGSGYSGFRESMQVAEGSFTTAISYLYWVMQEMEKCEGITELLRQEFPAQHQQPVEPAKP